MKLLLTIFVIFPVFCFAQYYNEDYELYDLNQVRGVWAYKTEVASVADFISFDKKEKKGKPLTVCLAIKPDSQLNSKTGKGTLSVSFSDDCFSDTVYKTEVIFDLKKKNITVSDIANEENVILNCTSKDYYPGDFSCKSQKGDGFHLNRISLNMDKPNNPIDA